MTLHKIFLPFVLLAAALWGLAGCGLIEEGPSNATEATVNGMQAITDGVAAAVLPGDVSGTTVPYSAGGGEMLDAFASGALANLGGLSRPMAIVNFDGSTPANCPVGGTVTLTGDADVTDNRGGSPFGTISILFSDMAAAVNACEGYGHSSTGNLTAMADDLITITDSGSANIENWAVDRDEMSNGTLAITKTATATTYNVNLSWHRTGLLNFTVDRNYSPARITNVQQNQTLQLNVNGQACTGVYTGSLWSPYDWNCN